MTEGLSNLIDIFVGVLVVAIFMFIFVPFNIMMYGQKFGGFNTQIEKTAETTTGVVSNVEPNISQGDVLMMIAIADKYEPNPKKLNINGTTIDLGTSDLGANRQSLLQTAYSKLDWTWTKGKLITAVGPDGQKEWRYVKKWVTNTN